jgi:hypothetical protein
LKLELKQASGSWSSVNAEADDQEGPPLPELAMRRAAMAEVKRYGIGYLLFDDRDYEAKDLQQKAWQWGIDFVDEKGNAKLYRIR